MNGDVFGPTVHSGYMLQLVMVEPELYRASSESSLASTERRAGELFTERASSERAFLNYQYTGGKNAISLRIKKKSRIFWHEIFKIEYFWRQN